MDLCILTKIASWLSYYSLLILFRNAQGMAALVAVVVVVAGPAVVESEAGESEAVDAAVGAHQEVAVEAHLAAAGVGSAEEQLLLEVAEGAEGEHPLAGMVVLGAAEEREDPELLDRRTVLEIIP